MMQISQKFLKNMYYLLTCGSNGNYQLGINNDKDQNTLQASLFNIDGKLTNEVPGKPTKVVGGGNHTLVLLDSGEVYACGSNEFGQCGISRCNNLTSFTKLGDRDWIDVECGWEFSLLVNKRNEIYVCGNGLKGELGLGKETKQSELAYCTRVEKFKRIKSCMQHTIVETTDGKLLGWGNCRKGQLGETNEKIFWIPTVLKFEIPVDDFSLGREFTAIQSGLNKVKIYGKFPSDSKVDLFTVQEPIFRMETMWSSVHILSSTSIQSYGNNSHDQFFPPSENIPVEECSMGSEHGLVQSGNTVYAWGWSEHGNCGRPDIQNQRQTFDYLNKLYVGDDKVILIGTGCATSWVAVET